MLSGVFYLFIYEYMIGLEAVRVLLMGYVIFQSPSTNKKKQWGTLLLNWLPYVIGAGAFLYWRIFMFSGSRQTTDIGTLLQTYQAQPLQGLLTLLIDTLKSFVNSVVVAWGLPLYDATLNAQYSDLAISVVLAVVGVGLLVGYIFWMERSSRPGTDTEEPQADHWARDAMWLGGLITLVTLVPVVLSGRDVEFDGGFDRYTLQSTIGIALLVIGAIFTVPRVTWRNSMVAILVALSIITQYNNTTYYRRFLEHPEELVVADDLAHPQPQERHGDDAAVAGRLSLWRGFRNLGALEPHLPAASGPDQDRLRGVE